MDLKCDICSLKFSFSQNLRRHDKKFHPDKLEEILPKNISAQSSYRCPVCKINFTRNSGLRRHVKNFHPAKFDDIILKSNKDFKCDVCDKSFAHKTNLEHHKRTKHQELTSFSKFLHKCVFCEFYDKRRHDIVKHYEEKHHLPIESEELEFKTIGGFQSWKKDMESNTSTFFAKVYESNEPEDGCRKIKFICNRSGYYKSKGEGLRKLKQVGSLKIDGVCPAEIDALVFEDKRHVVHYVKSHCGHKNDYMDKYLTKYQREAIAVKIAADVPFRIILDEKRDSTVPNSNLERDNRISRKDLYNIAKCFKLENESRVHVDGLSVEDWVKEMSERDCVIYHKLKGSFCNICLELLEDDFVMIIMNQGQKKILNKYASNCICIDRTHYLNNDRMELISLFVLDEDNQAFPCAFLVTNRIDAETISLFYSCIKEKIGTTLETNIFISDLDDIFYSSWLEVMGTPQFRFFCPWHLEKAWRDNLQRITSRRVQSAVYNDLKLLQQEEDPEVFSSNFIQFEEKWSIEESLDFIIYFRENFNHNHQVWAEYYKIKNGLNLGIDLQIVHEDISKLFVFGKNNNRLNMAVTAIMNYVSSRLFEKISKSRSETLVIVERNLSA